MLKFNVKVTFFVNGVMQEKKREVITTSVSLAWRSGLGMVPIDVLKSNQVQIKVDPVR
ncbi:hypothetical protein [Thiomicrorhabdus aquaedulcis]|uniref:hypothetical protein n=1 Tax=Thiomicrorhabdus aquaedulcis TaxID=2211106 RepID=UPI001562043C|nr:hypothetical protein [Thiomicrorhabdus aquaedulcis]